MSFIYHVLSPCMPLHIPFPLPRTGYTPLANSSFLSFKVKLKVICYSCLVLYSFAMFFHCWQDVLFQPLTCFGQQNKVEVMVDQYGGWASRGLKHALLYHHLENQSSPTYWRMRNTWNRAKSLQGPSPAQPRPADGQPSPRPKGGPNRAAQPTPSYPEMHEQSVCY